MGTDTDHHVMKMEMEMEMRDRSSQDDENTLTADIVSKVRKDAENIHTDTELKSGAPVPPVTDSRPRSRPVTQSTLAPTSFRYRLLAKVSAWH